MKTYLEREEVQSGGRAVGRVECVREGVSGSVRAGLEARGKDAPLRPAPLVPQSQSSAPSAALRQCLKSGWSSTSAASVASLGLR